MTSNTQDDCATTCRNHHLICEPAFFPHINTWNVFELLNVTCAKKVVPEGAERNTDYPAFDDSKEEEGV